MKIKRLENKINKWYGKDAPEGIRVWIAKHYHRWITFGCSQCWIENCNCPHDAKYIDHPKGFTELGAYCYYDLGYKDRFIASGS